MPSKIFLCATSIFILSIQAHAINNQSVTDVKNISQPLVQTIKSNEVDSQVKSEKLLKTENITAMGSTPCNPAVFENISLALSQGLCN